MRRWSLRTGTGSRGRRGWTTPTSWSARGWGRRPRCRSSTVRASERETGDRLHLAQARETLERLGLDLTHALARQAEPPADLLEGLRLGVVEPVAEDQHLALALRERRKSLCESLAAERDLDLLVGQRPVTGDEIAEDGVLGVADGLVEAGRGPRRRLDLVSLGNGEIGLLRDFLERGLAAELRPEGSLGAVQLLHSLDDVNRHPDRARLVRERPGNRLADPPRGVGRELVAAAPVELLDGANQAERAFLDQVEERQPLVAVVLGDRDDETQVRLDHRLLRLAVTALDPLCELDLLRGGQQRMPARVA